MKQFSNNAELSLRLNGLTTILKGAGICDSLEKKNGMNLIIPAYFCRGGQNYLKTGREGEMALGVTDEEAQARALKKCLKHLIWRCEITEEMDSAFKEKSFDSNFLKFGLKYKDLAVGYGTNLASAKKSSFLELYKFFIEDRILRGRKILAQEIDLFSIDNEQLSKLVYAFITKKINLKIFLLGEKSSFFTILVQSQKEVEGQDSLNFGLGISDNKFGALAEALLDLGQKIIEYSQNYFDNKNKKLKPRFTLLKNKLYFPRIQANLGFSIKSAIDRLEAEFNQQSNLEFRVFRYHHLFKTLGIFLVQPIFFNLNLLPSSLMDDFLIESKILCLQKKYQEALQKLENANIDNKYINFIKFICFLGLSSKSKAEFYFNKFKLASSKDDLKDIFFFLPKI